MNQNEATPAVYRRGHRPSDQLPAMKEKAFMKQVVELAKRLHWETYHPWLSVYSAAGWPDLALVKPPRLILAELKSAKGKVSAAQQKWLDLLRQCPGVEVYVWRPDDLDQIAEVLQ